MPAPELDLAVRPRAAPRAARPKAIEEDAPLELAVDPRSLVQERAAGAHMGQTAQAGQTPPMHGVGLQVSPAAPMVPASGHGKRSTSLAPPAVDLETDARVLADYGEAPGSPLLSPLYAFRVFKRQRELKAALAVRAAEAEHARTTLEDALVALAERVRPVAEKNSAYRAALDDLTRVEEQLRSRDKVLAAEQDAQRARLAQVDARIAKAESELSQAQGHERAVATELSGVQGGLAREEAKIKQAETELRAAQQREGSRGAATR
jgi:hypothetical protein